MCGILELVGFGASHGQSRIGTTARSSEKGLAGGQTGVQPDGAIPGKGKPPVSRNAAGVSRGVAGHFRGASNMLGVQNVDAGIVGCGCGCGTHVIDGPMAIGGPRTGTGPVREWVLTAGVSATGMTAGVMTVSAR